MATKPKKPAVMTVSTLDPVPVAGVPATIEPAAFPAPVSTTPKPGIDYEYLTELGRQNLSAVVQANEALTEGLEAIGKELVFYTRTSLERAGQATTALLGAKTLDEVVQLNADLARASLETLLQRSARISEMGLSLATQTFAPFDGRVEAALAFAARAQVA